MLLTHIKPLGSEDARQVGDVRVYFEVIGERLVPDGQALRELPTMILLHCGPGFDHNSLRPHLAPLADVAQLIFLDHRGQGRSDPSTPDRWNLDTWIHDLAGFCDVLGIEAPIVFGHSFGGMAALGLGVRYPGLPSKLVISNSAAKFRPDRALDMFERLGGAGARAAAQRYFETPSENALERFMDVCYPLYGTVPIPTHVRGSSRGRRSESTTSAARSTRSTGSPSSTASPVPRSSSAASSIPSRRSHAARRSLQRSRTHSSRCFVAPVTHRSATGRAIPST